MVGLVGARRTTGVMAVAAFSLYGMDIAPGMLWIRSLGTATEHGYMVTLAS